MAALTTIAAMQSDEEHDPREAVATPASTPALDLDAIGQDLADVEVALARLDAGTYWVDETTGAELSDDLLAEHPTARRTSAG